MSDWVLEGLRGVERGVVGEVVMVLVRLVTSSLAGEGREAGAGGWVRGGEMIGWIL